MRLQGRIGKHDLEGGGYFIEAEGQRYTLLLDPKFQRRMTLFVGQDWIIEGEREDGFGIFMQGPEFRVNRLVAVVPKG